MTARLFFRTLDCRVLRVETFILFHLEFDRNKKLPKMLTWIRHWHMDGHFDILLSVNGNLGKLKTKKLIFSVLK